MATSSDMLAKYIREHRDDVVDEARTRFLGRSVPKPGCDLGRGFPVFVDQLVTALERNEITPSQETTIDDDAIKNGEHLFELGFTTSEIVHGYGVICDILMERAEAEQLAVSLADFTVLNRSLDAAIACSTMGYEARRTEEDARHHIEHLGALAHELRNSVSAIAIAFDAIKQGDVGAGGYTGQVLERNVVRLSTLIDRALAEVRLRHDPKPVFERIRIADVIDDLVLTLGREARQRGVDLELETDQAIEIDSDDQLLGSIVFNLVHNAIKYTRTGGRVAMCVVRDGQRLTIEVADECGGLTDEQIAKMFQPFERGTTATPGVGLGLSIAARAVAALGGVIDVRNVPDTGCVFRVELPQRP